MRPVTKPDTADDTDPFAYHSPTARMNWARLAPAFLIRARGPARRDQRQNRASIVPVAYDLLARHTGSPQQRQRRLEQELGASNE